MIRKGRSAMPLPERRGPPCRSPYCLTENGPCHPGGNPDARTVNQPVSEPQGPETQCTSGNPGPQWRERLRQFVTWVLLTASMVAALSTIADGAHALMDLISEL